MRYRLTIDTNCINVRQAHAFMNCLERLAEQGLVEITTTFSLVEELDLDKTRLGEARRTKASHRPMAVSGFMIGHSAVGGLDVIGGPNCYAHVDAIAQIIAPGIAWETIDAKTQRDIVHLSAHRTYEWGLFITEEKRILKRAAELAKLDIRVMTPDGALQYLAEHGIS